MLTIEEQKFVDYWAVQRHRKKRSLRHFAIGLPLSVGIIFALFASIISGWHKKATMVLQSNSSQILVILIAAVGIVVFMTIFSMRYQWEQKEQQYQELLLKKQDEQNATN